MDRVIGFIEEKALTVYMVGYYYLGWDMGFLPSLSDVVYLELEGYHGITLLVYVLVVTLSHMVTYEGLRMFGKKGNF